ncbi:MAG: hypothetical protein JXR95_05885 [Deltaproteobacteria bacterium]|nr:hypothetical protein [Deltaproteobacteria bacterium]
MSLLTLESQKKKNHLSVLYRLTENLKLSRYYPEIIRFLNMLEILLLDNSSFDNSIISFDSKSNLPSGKEVTRLNNYKSTFNSGFQSGTFPDHWRSDSFVSGLLSLDIPSRLNFELIPIRNTTKFVVEILVILDRYSLSHELYTRYTVSMELPCNSHYFSNCDILIPSENLKNIICISCQGNSEIAMLSLGANDNFKVKQISRAQIGPLTDENMRISDYEFGNTEKLSVLHLPLEMAIKDQKNNILRDPFIHNSDEYYSKSTQEIFRQERKLKNYALFNERRLSITGNDNMTFERHFHKEFPHCHIIHSQGKHDFTPLSNKR